MKQLLRDNMMPNDNCLQFALGDQSGTPIQMTTRNSADFNEMLTLMQNESVNEVHARLIKVRKETCSSNKGLSEYRKGNNSSIQNFDIDACCNNTEETNLNERVSVVLKIDSECYRPESLLSSGS